MSKEKRIGCALAAAVIAIAGLGAYVSGGPAVLAGYALGTFYAGLWAWVLRGVK